MSLLARILSSIRSAALLGGLSQVTQIHLDIGGEAPVVPEVLLAALKERFRGDLLGKCAVKYRIVEGHEVRVQSVEGIPAPAPPGVV
ncbi:MAG: hypothetical protein VX764_00905 [Planctomycetota bacterium]|nr:hypothetical protein [Planctomycetota bacterium]